VKENAMSSLHLTDWVKRDTGRAYWIPKKVASVMETDLACEAEQATEKGSPNGLRWECNYEKSDRTRGVLFFERIGADEVDLYILPSAKRQWKTMVMLESLLKKKKAAKKYLNYVDSKENDKHLRMKNVTWDDAVKILPHLVKWIRSNVP
jgi:hypothetical protein